MRPADNERMAPMRRTKIPQILPSHFIIAFLELGLLLFQQRQFLANIAQLPILFFQFAFQFHVFRAEVEEFSLTRFNDLVQ